MTPLQVALRDFLAFGKPCEGSFRYHDAWKKLQDAYNEDIGATNEQDKPRAVQVDKVD